MPETNTRNLAESGGDHASTPYSEATEPAPVTLPLEPDTAIAPSDEITIVVEGEIIEASDNVTAFENPSHPLVWVVLGFYCVLLPVASLIFQLLLIYSTPRAVVTLLPQEQTISVKTVQQINARVLPALSLAQTTTAQTTGHGHQDATAATGAITFYNGAFTSQFLPAGTILTGLNGVQVITEQQASLPAANPPSFAEATVLARSVQYGTRGNIAAYAINTLLTASIFAKNTGSFTGGEDARDFSTVTKTDISTLANDLVPMLDHSMSAALQSQLTPDEALYTFPCHKTISPNHQAGEEAAIVTVTVAETCRSLAYDKQELQTRATRLVTTKALSQFGAGYSIMQPITATITNVTMQQNTITLSLSCQATSVYQFSRRQQQRLKQDIAGKSKQEALRLLLHKAGIQGALIDGVEETAALPRNTDSIAITILHPVA